MRAKNKKNPKKIDLLKMSDIERMKLIRGVKEKLREKMMEQKLWQSLVEAEDVTINGKTISMDQASLANLYLKNQL
jgi:ATP-dependent DNA ligase